MFVCLRRFHISYPLQLPIKQKGNARINSNKQLVKMTLGNRTVLKQY